MNLALAAGAEVLLVDTDTYGGAVTHTNIQKHHRTITALVGMAEAGTGTATLVTFCELHGAHRRLNDAQ